MGAFNARHAFGEYPESMGPNAVNICNCDYASKHCCSMRSDVFLPQLRSLNLPSSAAEKAVSRQDDECDQTTRHLGETAYAAFDCAQEKETASSSPSSS